MQHAIEFDSLLQVVRYFIISTPCQSNVWVETGRKISKNWRMDMAQFTLSVNGRDHSVDADPDMPLLYALRNDLGLSNPHFGCGLAQCGACTVHVAVSYTHLTLPTTPYV